MNKLWYSFFSLKHYDGEEPSFWKSEDFDWIKNIEDNHDKIKKELDDYLQNKFQLTPYYNINYISKAGAWKTISLKFWDLLFDDKIKEFPETYKVIEKIPGCVTASFSMLEPNSNIKAHHGDTNAIVKAHLGIYIPESLPIVGFRVREEKKSWEEGKVFVFTDAYNHEAWNHSDQQRWILLLDVIQEKFISKRKNICHRNIAFNAVESILSKLSFIGKILSPLRGIFIFMLTPFVPFLLKFYKK